MNTTRQTELDQPADASIVFELRPTNQRVRSPCFICGGQTDGGSVLCIATVADPDGAPISVIACRQCQEGDPNARMRRRLDIDEERIAWERSLVGRIVLPGASAWDEAAAEAEREWQDAMRVVWAARPDLRAAMERTCAERPALGRRLGLGELLGDDDDSGLPY
jgi:hypothetical protein